MTTTHEGFWANLFSAENTLGELLDGHNNPVALSDLNPIVLVLLSAYWCPPCRALTPSVVEFVSKHPTDVSVVYFSRDYNPEMQAFNLRTKSVYNRFAWHAENVETFKRLKVAYPSIQGIPTMFAVDRDSGKIFTERAAVSIRIFPDTVVDQWKNGQDITQEEEDEYWSRSRASNAPEVDIVEHLPLDTIVDADGAPIGYDSLKQFVLFYFNAKWAHNADGDKLTPAISAFAKANADDVSVVYYSLDANADDAKTEFASFKHSANLIETAYQLDKTMTKDNPYNTLAAPRVIVVEKESHAVVAKHHYGILIKPDEVLGAWKVGEAGITDAEVGAWFQARWEAEQKKKAEEEAAKAESA
ncbi:hypothetical protein SDRG_15727 [Saprolegnia diclina VS20]|uniref:Thioredoxin domain-containing protein n=1 Tax=Saprolegnia diclina (strain VS20) TaxID=1156394 RepID=T0PW26_SAPDV|nr:hypothetical protein SDRG_15727 [Saprolegnia diclina VS20]EQC26446.1 hypothetical protein SDRG_15727 [Saprolegnia diclina VS20]|eukprot:XP_008620131.1 hypothetical protein SDRG_15727 [Saprolegnia diclina VS20]